MSKVQFTFNSGRCIKCWACEIACKQWNGRGALQPGRRRVFEVVKGTFPSVERTFISMGCLHCDDPNCVKVCPTHALRKRESDGIVCVDTSVCIGCRHCFGACPYGIPQFENGVMDKCDCCLGNGVNAAAGELPHCVATCPTGALGFELVRDDASQQDDTAHKDGVDNRSKEASSSACAKETIDCTYGRQDDYQTFLSHALGYVSEHPDALVW